jgi:hypothetical protein
MNLPNVVAIIGLFISVGSLSVAVVEHLALRNRKRTESEMLAKQSERLRAALIGAARAEQTADRIVQRSKDGDATLIELTILARVLRDTLQGHTKLLDDQNADIKRIIQENRYASSPRMSHDRTSKDRSASGPVR